MGDAARRVYGWFKWASDVWQMAKFVTSLGGGVVLIIWGTLLANLGKLELWQQVVFGIGVAACFGPFLLVGVAALLFRRSPKSYAEFYPTRASVNAATGELECIIRKANRVWCAWHSGTDAAHRNIWTGGKIERLVLMHPGMEKGDYLPIQAPIFGMRTESIADDIKVTTEKAQAGDVKPKWFRGPILNSVIIINPKERGSTRRKRNGIARIELQMPYSHTPRSRPIIVIHERQYAELFEQLCNQYEQLWNASDWAPKLVPDKEASQPKST